MSFTGFSFLLYFLPAVVVCASLLPGKAASLRSGLLLLASVVFAFTVQPKCLLLLAGVTIFCFFAARLVERCQKPGGKRALFTVALVVLLGVLSGYKLLLAMNSPAVVPVGISFVIFTAISYLTDCYRGSIPAERNVAKLGLYFGFFPKLTQGPLTRYNEWQTPQKPDVSTLCAGAERFVLGLGKKVLLASAMTKMADGVFSSHTPGALAAWLGVIAYAFEIYFDFSGYTDMAIGIGKMLGVSLPENFRDPYMAQSVTDFWRRWHMSLSRWFRDYLYIPLGGNRKGTAVQMRNLLIVWLATGLWHGFTENYLIWGLWFAMLLIAEKLFFGKVLQRLPAVFRSAYTLCAVLLSWVFFRSADFPSAGGYLRAMFSGGASENLWFLLRQYGIELCLCAALCTPVGKKFLDAMAKKPLGRVFKAGFLLGVFALCILQLNGATLNAFIYAQF